MLYRFSTMGQNWVKNYELLFGQDIDRGGREKLDSAISEKLL